MCSRVRGAEIKLPNMRPGAGNEDKSAGFRNEIQSCVCSCRPGRPTQHDGGLEHGVWGQPQGAGLPELVRGTSSDPRRHLASSCFETLDPPQPGSQPALSTKRSVLVCSAAVTKHHRRGGLNNRQLLSHILEAGRPRSRCWQGWIPLRPCSPCVLAWTSSCACLCPHLPFI